MSRTVSLNMREAVYAQQTGEIIVCLLTITHSSLPEPIYLSTDATQRLTEDPELTYGTISRGNTYLFLPISVVLPDDSDGTPPGVTLTIDNISRMLVPLVRSLNSQRERAKVTVEMLRVADLDTVEVSLPAFDLMSAKYDALQVTLTLGVDALATEQYPTGSFVPSGFPALY